MLLSALLGAIGSVSVMAQNVYSLNAVGYINVTAVPGFTMIACPLIGANGNSIGALLNNSANQYKRRRFINGAPANHPISLMKRALPWPMPMVLPMVGKMVVSLP